MSVYENLNHGTADFPIGIHNTKSSGGFWLYPHTHREFEFLVLTKGSGIVFIDNNEYHLCRGEGIFINSHCLHLGQESEKCDCEFFAVVFAPEFFGNFSSDLILKKYVLPIMENTFSLPSVYRPSVPWQKDILNRLISINNINSSKEEGLELLIKEELFHIWRTAFSHKIISFPKDHSSVGDMVSAMEFIRANYSLHLTLARIAESVNMSEGHFSRKFAKTMHITPFEYLNRIRIDNSCRMLSDTNLSVGEVADNCGFNGFSYFSKRFREYVGCTPGEYKKKHQKNRL